jgi:hypothetical protein
VAWVGFVVSLAGIGLVTAGGGGGATAAGDGLVLASLLLSATFTVAQTRLLRGRDPVAVTAVQFLGAALAVLPFSAATEGMPTASGGPGSVLAAAGLAAGGTLLPFTLFAYAQSRVSAEVAGAFLNLEPLVGAAAGVVVFGDPAGLRQLTGGAAILGGIALSSLPLLGTSRRPARPTTERRDEPQQVTREQRRPATVPGLAAPQCALAAGSRARAGARYGRACRYARRPQCWPGRRRPGGLARPRFPCWWWRSRPGATARGRRHTRGVDGRRPRCGIDQPPAATLRWAGLVWHPSLHAGPACSACS